MYEYEYASTVPGTVSIVYIVRIPGYTGHPDAAERVTGEVLVIS